MPEQPRFSEVPEEYGGRTLKPGRMYHLCRERQVEDMWSVVVLVICACEGMRTKEA